MQPYISIDIYKKNCASFQVKKPRNLLPGKRKPVWLVSVMIDIRH